MGWVLPKIKLPKINVKITPGGKDFFSKTINDPTGSTIKFLKKPSQGLLDSQGATGSHDEWFRSPEAAQRQKDIEKLRADVEYNKPENVQARLISGMEKDLGDYQSSIGGLKQKDVGSLGDSLGYNLQQGLMRTRRNYAARGLLHSGLEQGAEEGLKGQAASQYNQGRADINKEYEQGLSARQTAIQLARLGNYNDAINKASDLYNAQAANQQARIQATGALSQGLGTVAGLLAGRAKATDGGLLGSNAASGGSYGSGGGSSLVYDRGLGNNSSIQTSRFYNQPYLPYDNYLGGQTNQYGW